MNQLGNTDMGLGGSFNDCVFFFKERDLKYIMIGNEKLLEEYKSQSEYFE